VFRGIPEIPPEVVLSDLTIKAEPLRLFDITLHGLGLETRVILSDGQRNPCKKCVFETSGLQLNNGFGTLYLWKLFVNQCSGQFSSARRP